MKVVIPMAGTSDRFSKEGYNVPKPLIQIEGKSMIEHIITMFSEQDDFIFICNIKNLQKTNIEEVLKKVKPSGKIIGIDFKKLGPAWGVLEALKKEDFIRDDESVIVNYCDFGWDWDYEDFKKTVKEKNCDGCVTAYKGFHPHLLGFGLYASMRVDNNNWMLECREKHSFTENKMDSFQQAGIFYFSNGAMLKKYFTEVVKRKLTVNGEYYVSVVTQLMKENDLKIYVYQLEHFLQWGTPQNLEECIYWSNIFRFKINKQPRYDAIVSKDLTLLVPMAGEGLRFKKDGYKTPKPLVDISGKPMVVQAINDLPKANKHIFLCRKDHIEQYQIDKTLRDNYSNTKIVKVDKLTEGQACTCLLAEGSVDMENPLLIGACDNGMLWNMNKFIDLVSNPKVGALIITFRHSFMVQRNPKAYGWVKIDKNENVVKVSCKIPISNNPLNDHAIVGSFYFKKAKYFFEGAKQMIKKNIRINNEFYVDTVMNELIENGLKVKVFEIDKYICWGAPDDLRTYEYWQKYFDNAKSHPYSKKLDEDFD